MIFCSLSSATPSLGPTSKSVGPSTKSLGTTPKNLGQTPKGIGPRARKRVFADRTQTDDPSSSETGMYDCKFVRMVSVVLSSQKVYCEMIKRNYRQTETTK